MAGHRAERRDPALAACASFASSLRCSAVSPILRTTPAASPAKKIVPAAMRGVPVSAICFLFGRSVQGLEVSPEHFERFGIACLKKLPHSR